MTGLHASVLYAPASYNKNSHELRKLDVLQKADAAITRNGVQRRGESDSIQGYPLPKPCIRIEDVCDFMYVMDPRNVQ